jgi:hypothetical protein
LTPKLGFVLARLRTTNLQIEYADSNRDLIQYRLKTEVFNLALGVEKGDQVEAQYDPQVQKAVESPSKPPV